MPISASAKKSLRVAQRQAGENKVLKIRMKNTVKQVTTETLAEAFRVLDKAAKNHIIHKNKAARLKSRLAKKVATHTETKPKVKSVKATTRTKTVK